MDKLLLTSIAALFLATGTAHAYPITPEGEPNPLEIRPPDTIATLSAKPGSPSCKKLDMELINGEMHVNADCWGEDLWLKTGGISKCYPAITDKLERQDDISFVEYTHCGSIKRGYLFTLKGYGDLDIYNTNNY